MTLCPLNSGEQYLSARWVEGLDMIQMTAQLSDLKEQLLYPGKKWSVPELRAVVDVIHNHHVIDTTDRFHNRFFHEIRPFLIIAESVGDKGILVELPKGYSRIDGIIWKRGDQTQRTEMTTAIDGRNDALQMELLKQRGHAPAFVPIAATGTKRNRQFGSNENPGFQLAKYLSDTLLPLQKSAIAKKIKMAKTNPNYPGAWLGVVLDDWVEPIVERKKEKIDPVCRAALGDSCESYAPFTRVFFVGVSGEYLFDSDSISP